MRRRPPGILRSGVSTLVTWAKRPGRNDGAAVLQKTLDKEKATDQKLTQLTESGINLKAASQAVRVVHWIEKP